MKEGQFREDLYYRLSVLEVTIPPLRSRRGDIIPLVHHFLRQTGSRHYFSPEALERLKCYAWPGNVRQLRNLVTKLSVTASKDTDCFQLEDVEEILRKWEMDAGSFASEEVQETLADREKASIIAALRAVDYQISAAARHLGIHRNTLYNKIKKYSIDIHKTTD